ncbi:MAG TPA: hypothetical protein ENG14_05340 [Thermodesulforhabdus norvegica]|uniref:Uncharacterized protein n=1 Tax=Thermodesulforhabdus norvegica TaxID=39841 RepID=A0A7C0WSI6_9BACT|nr:hypothetical protein [Thermodesulforhabdus norvegica]
MYNFAIGCCPPTYKTDRSWGIYIRADVVIPKWRDQEHGCA